MNQRDQQPTLVRAIRRWDLVALFINGVIGAGIFGLPATVYKLTGTWSLAAFVLCAFLIVLIVLCFAELGSRFSDTGGPYLYAREAFGSLAGFEVGWLLWLARLTAFAALCNLFVQYSAYFVPALGSGWWRGALITLFVAVITTVNLLGVRKAALVGNAFTIGKLIPLILFALVGLFFVQSSNFAFGERPDHTAFSKAVLLLVFAFSGFEVPVITAGETREPRKQMPFALLTAISVIVLLYILIQIVCIGTLGASLGTSARPLADAAGTIHKVGGTIIAIGALISVTGTMNSIMLAAPRLLFAMAEHRQLPSMFATTHPRWRTPHFSILLTSAAMLALTLSGSFLSALTLSTITRLLAYAATCAAVPVLRRRGDIAPAEFRVKAGMLVSVAALVLCAWLLSSTTWPEIRNVSIAAVAGLVLHLVFIRNATISPSPHGFEVITQDSQTRSH